MLLVVRPLKKPNVRSSCSALPCIGTRSLNACFILYKDMLFAVFAAHKRLASKGAAVPWPKAAVQQLHLVLQCLLQQLFHATGVLQVIIKSKNSCGLGGYRALYWTC